jgi:hypothetical protein
VQGNALLALDFLFVWPPEKYVFAGIRLETCRLCDESTWMTVAEYAGWIEKNGGMVKFASQIDKLTSWPALPKQEYSPKKKLFCRVCKCWLPAKTYVKNEQCPLNKWSNENG